MFNKILKSGLVTVGLASVVGLAPTLMGVAPANALGEIETDGVLTEYTTDEAPWLAQGINGPAVEDLQMFLEDEDYYDGAIDGIYGPMTENAVREFQVDQDLVADGIVGDNTWNSLANFEEEGVFNEDEALSEDEGVFNEEEGVFNENEEAFGEEEDIF